MFLVVHKERGSHCSCGTSENLSRCFRTRRGTQGPRWPRDRSAWPGRAEPRQGVHRGDRAAGNGQRIVGAQCRPPAKNRRRPRHGAGEAPHPRGLYPQELNQVPRKTPGESPRSLPKHRAAVLPKNLGGGEPQAALLRAHGSLAALGKGHPAPAPSGLAQRSGRKTRASLLRLRVRGLRPAKG